MTDFSAYSSRNEGKKGASVCGQGVLQIVGFYDTVVGICSNLSWNFSWFAQLLPEGRPCGYPVPVPRSGWPVAEGHGMQNARNMCSQCCADFSNLAIQL